MTSANARKMPASGPTFVGDDFPRYLPFNASNSETIEAVLEESLRFSTTRENAANWQAILPGDVGYIRLGPSHRVFAISMFHQLHCLVQLAGLLANTNPDLRKSKALPNWEDMNHSGHVQHCFNYVRQNILCAADETEEDGGWMCRNFETVRTDGRKRRCKEWSKGYEAVEVMQAEWERPSRTELRSTS